ncbi:MAG: DUF523 and DUF1722 domain-containing protein [Candidatus Wallbacteria bacterium]|nr:DUF523 and DUF1722 domain-containing protein [Candidatus Wallbacteria bacterium]
MNNTQPIKIGVSSCLLGNPVRYDGNHKQDHFATDVLSTFFEFVPVCPEIELGMGVPREAIHLVGDPENPRLLGVRSKKDWTETMRNWATERIRKLESENLCGFIFRKKSPSSGLFRVPVHNEKGSVIGHGSGIFAGMMARAFPLVPMEEDGRLNDLTLRENFLERVFAFHRLMTLTHKPFSRSAVVAFHTAHKLQLMAHSITGYRELGSLTASVSSMDPQQFTREYQQIFLRSLALIATPAKNTNVLQHMSGYLKKLLNSDEKQELQALITDYRTGLVPLIVPVTLIKHYVRKYSISYLQGQTYLEPHPKELLLRNHS